MFPTYALCVDREQYTPGNINHYRLSEWRKANAEKSPPPPIHHGTYLSLTVLLSSPLNHVPTYISCTDSYTCDFAGQVIFHMGGLQPSKCLSNGL